jgi:hypothetical protein
MQMYVYIHHTHRHFMYRWLNIPHPHSYLSLWNILTQSIKQSVTGWKSHFYFHVRRTYIVLQFPYIWSINSIGKSPHISLFFKSEKCLGRQILRSLCETQLWIALQKPSILITHKIILIYHTLIPYTSNINASSIISSMLRSTTSLV